MLNITKEDMDPDSNLHYNVLALVYISVCVCHVVSGSVKKWD